MFAKCPCCIEEVHYLFVMLYLTFHCEAVLVKKCRYIFIYCLYQSHMLFMENIAQVCNDIGTICFLWRILHKYVMILELVLQKQKSQFSGHFDIKHWIVCGEVNLLCCNVWCASCNLWWQDQITNIRIKLWSFAKPLMQNVLPNL